ncbi:MAG: glycosyltransferase, partial [Methanobacterium paludis]|nr:glycosyltransferase [Methanobacterium paludis]
RVYDALINGAMVITNGELGAAETFEGKLPVYRSAEELNNLIIYYMSHENKRKAKIQELQEFVMENHTYDHRARTLKQILEKYILKTKISIKIPAPNWKEVQEWGDYYLALGLKKELEKKDCKVKLQTLPEWDSKDDADCDVVIVLRGLSKYKPKKQHFNIMWNISHPNKVSIKEYNQYDHVFIASEIWATKIKGKIDVPVEAMLQCTDPELFYPDPDDKYKHDILFVGNSRKVYRKIIKDLLPTDKDLAVYGTSWNGLIPDRYIKGEHIPNNELRKAYSSCKILLNDHWDDMRENGFISNRLFDGFASGAFIISDRIEGVGAVFGDALVTYDHPEELKLLIKYYLNNEKERIKKAERGHELVIDQNTYKNRADNILKIAD